MGAMVSWGCMARTHLLGDKQGLEENFLDGASYSEKCKTVFHRLGHNYIREIEAASASELDSLLQDSGHFQTQPNTIQEDLGGKRDQLLFLASGKMQMISRASVYHSSD